MQASVCRSRCHARYVFRPVFDQPEFSHQREDRSIAVQRMSLIGATLLLTVSASALGNDAVNSFSRWFGQYKRGRIDLYEQMESGFRTTSAGGGTGARYYRTEGVDQLEGLLRAVVQQGGERAAQLLVDAAVYRADPDPERERKKYTKRQPWLVRRLATEALCQIPDEKVMDWLRETPLSDRSVTEGSARRAVAARVLGCLRDRNSTAALTRLLGDPELSVRMAAARALGDLGDPMALEPLTRLVENDHEKARLEGLLSVDRIIAKEVTSERQELRLRVARKALLDDSWPVRLAACDILLRNPDESSLPALIRAIGDESPGREGSRRRVRSALRRTLATLTGEDYPSFRPEDWEAWWQRVQAGFRLPELEVSTVAPEQGARFCGLPVESDVVVFLLDISGSMNQPVAGDPDGPARIFIALRETRRCVEALEEGTHFNIVLFNDKIHPFMNEPVEKSAATLESATRFMRTVQTDGGTDLFGALDHVLDLGGARPHGMPVVGDLDTLVVLTDGMPSRGTVLIPEEILHQVSQANRPHRIAIHTVNAGGTGEAFLKRLAGENFGESCSLRN